jgi:hypothetical protein
MEDYRKVDRSHRLSAYKVRIPGWKGNGSIRTPFANWQNAIGSLAWYQDYNKSKHNRHEYFWRASFKALTDAMCGLVVVLSAQFYDEDYSPTDKLLGMGRSYSYDTGDDMDSAIGSFFRVKFPTDWPSDERYDFNWNELEDLENPFVQFQY